MSILITMVGTSLFSNYEKTKRESDIVLPSIKSELKWMEDMERQRDKNKAVVDYVKENSLSGNSRWTNLKIAMQRFVTCGTESFWKIASAEIQSIIAFQKECKDTTVILLASDTIESYFISMFLNDFLDEKEFRVIFRPEVHVIDGLRVEDNEILQKKGIPNLIDLCTTVQILYEDDIVINITGGYKGIIPILTVIRELYDISMIYMYENTEELIFIPEIPVEFDEDELRTLIIEEDYESYTIGEKAAQKLKKQHRLNISPGIMDSEGQFTMIGQILWKYFLDKNYNVFYMSDYVYSRLKEREDAKRMLQKPMEELLSDRYTNNEGNDHVLFSDRHNGTYMARIYYYPVETDDETKYMIYALYGCGRCYKRNPEHDAHMAYWKSIKRNKAMEANNADPTVHLRLIDKNEYIDLKFERE